MKVSGDMSKVKKEDIEKKTGKHENEKCSKKKCDGKDDCGKPVDEDKVENTKADEEVEGNDGAHVDKKEAKADAEKADDVKTEEPADDKYIRLMADFQNFKRRTEKEKSDIYAYAKEQLLMDLLPVMDNFERALEHADKGNKYAQGIEMIFKQMKDALEKSGLKEIEAFEKPFDPNFHNAVLTEDKEGVESGHVTEVLQKGYMLNGKVIRPSMVKVNN